MLLTFFERMQLIDFKNSPRSRTQTCRVDVLLALDAGMRLETVARKYQLEESRLTAWVHRFQEERLRFLREPETSGLSEAETIRSAS